MESWIPARAASSIVADFRFACCLVKTPRQLQVTFEKFQSHALRSFEDLSSCAWEVAADLFITPFSWARLLEEDLEPSLVDDWKQVFQSILQNGNVDIHGMAVDPRGGIQGEHSTMFHLLHQHSNPENLVRHLAVWLEVLQACNVQVQQYLDRELAYCKQNFDPRRIDSEFEVELCQETILGFTSPYWRTKDLTTSPARELLQEYPHFGKRSGWVLVGITGIGAVLMFDRNLETFSKAEATFNDDDFWRLQWPFFSPTYLQEFDHDQFNSRGSKDLKYFSFTRKRELQDQRLERRRVRKLGRSGRASRRRHATMPGTWVEDWE